MNLTIYSACKRVLVVAIMSAQNNLEINVDHQIEKLLQDVAEEEGLTKYNIEKSPGSFKGDGYLGVITAIEITGTTESNKKKTLNLVVKSASKSDALRVEAPISSIFEREVYMYNTVIPVYGKFQVEKGLQPFSSSAKCYKACIIDRSEALVLENLKNQGYSVWDRKVPMEDEHVNLAMSEYGRFHALSYALRDQDLQRFEKLTATMDDIFEKLIKQADITKMFHKRCVKALYSLNPETDGEAIQKYKPFLNKVDSFFKSMSSFVDEYSVILHGDSWTNNMMFRYEDFNDPKKPTKMCLIDLQLSRLGPPVLDLSYFFYSCTSKKVINNWEHYLDIYYDSLSSYLTQLGTNAADVYPYSVFQKQWKDYAKFGLICSTLLIYAMLTDQSEATDLTDLAESGKKFVDAFDYDISNMDEYNDRVRHIILHFVGNNLI